MWCSTCYPWHETLPLWHVIGLQCWSLLHSTQKRNNLNGWFIITTHQILWTVAQFLASYNCTCHMYLATVIHFLQLWKQFSSLFHEQLLNASSFISEKYLYFLIIFQFFIQKNQYPWTCPHRSGCYSDNSLNLYAGGVRFKSRLRCFILSFSPLRQVLGQ